MKMQLLSKQFHRKTLWLPNALLCVKSNDLLQQNSYMFGEYPPAKLHSVFQNPPSVCFF